MDYKYIEQLLERYWRCETTLEEERILRTFFSQKDVPVELISYKALFDCQLDNAQNEKLGDDFDNEILEIIGEPMPVKARKITLRHRMMPLFRAAAVVAITITLSNALQVAFRSETKEEMNRVAVQEKNEKHGPSVAKSDSIKTDSLRRTDTDAVTIK